MTYIFKIVVLFINSQFFKTAEDASVWFAGKELFPEKKLQDYIGKNEKTKIICKLTPAGSGCPVREPLIQQKEYVNMLAYYKKKEKEYKSLDEDNDDAYLNQPWADTKQLKNQLHGQNHGISFKK